MSKELEGMAQPGGGFNGKAVLCQMAAQVLTSHEGPMLMHVYNQIEKTSPIFRQ